MRDNEAYKKGLAYALLSYGSWGVFPLYWKMLHQVPPQQILAHRVLWSMLFLTAVLIWRRDKYLKQYFRSPRKLAMLAATSLLIGTNWFLYIYAVNTNHIVDASLGYYINPVVNILLGVVFLKEKLSKVQIIAVGFAIAGVSILTWNLGRLPAISLLLAVNFALYALLRRVANLQSMPGLTIETLILAPVAIAFLGWVDYQGNGAFMHQSRYIDLLLILGGPVTALPLFWFGNAATRVPLSTLGFIQYLSPTLQLLIGIVVFGETFTTTYMLSFGLVWVGLAIYSYNILRSVRSS
jgi:chloramphenicol-sensitive protein RarD